MSDEAENQMDLDVLANANDPDQAWKALSLVNDWIRHADAKIGVTLALTSASGVMLYNLVKDACPGALLVVFGTASALATAVAAAFAVVGLAPRLTIRGQQEPAPETNLLFYMHVSKTWAEKSAEYVTALSALSVDKAELSRHIGEQVHANASVAHRKYVWANRAIWLLGLALLFVALTALARVLG